MYRLMAYPGQSECTACGQAHRLKVQYERCGVLWHVWRALLGSRPGRRWHAREALRTLVFGSGV